MPINSTTMIRRKVRCGACHGKIDRPNLVTIHDRKASWEYPVGGNVLTGEHGWPIAILCDLCADTHATIQEVVEFRNDEPVYHPIAEVEKIHA